MLENVKIKMNGHVYIADDKGNVLLDKCNAIHPQNMARIISRALANEDNDYIHRIAFGNGGTIVDAAYTISYRPPNDGQPPDSRTWDSRLYHETYSEIVDEGKVSVNAELGVDPGTAGPNVGNRPGGGSVPANDPPSTPHISGPGVRSRELGLISEVIVTAHLNPDEPTGQFVDDYQAPEEYTETSFMFDEIGLYSKGAPALPTHGYQMLNVDGKNSTDNTGLTADTVYDFQIAVDGGPAITITFRTPAAGGSGENGEILFGDLCEALNTGAPTWNLSGVSPLPNNSTVKITDTTGQFSTIAGAQTFGHLLFESGAAVAGVDTSVQLIAGAANDLFVALNGTLLPSVDGTNSGSQNDPTNPENERERLLSHIIFSPILKSKNRALTIIYTISILIARQDELTPCL